MEGSIKFDCNWIKEKLYEDIRKINFWREKLYSLKLIGAYENGIGFGNISLRKRKGFLISGTKTGGIEKLTLEHYTKVIDWDFDKNFLTCIGPIEASSESLSHAALYESDSKIKAVIHIHNLELWNKLMNKIPTTSKNAEYGTSEIAKEILRLYKETDVKEKKILIMGGHKEGIISFGKNLDEAGKILLEYFHKFI